MKVSCLFSLALSLLVLSCNADTFAKMQRSRSQEAVTALLKMQCDAWNRGDLDSFMTAYHDSPDTSYTSGGTEVWGYQALRDRYQQKYGASKETMGKLSFPDCKVLDLGSNYALCVGHWHLERPSQPDLQGTYSLVLMRSGRDWKILHDHTSLLKTDSKISQRHHALPAI